MSDATKTRYPASMLRMSLPGRNFVKRFEELRLKAYQDQGGIWTIGYGHTRGVKMGDVITEAQAETYLKGDLMEAERALALDSGVNLFQHEYDALVSLIFNIGVGHYSSSTIRRTLKMKRYDLAADEFPRWNKVKGKVSNGLKRRRHDEREIFVKATYRA